MASSENTDNRLQLLVTAPGSVYSNILAQPPPEPPALPEPRALDFLFLIQGFHLGCMPSARISRTSQLYESVVAAFRHLTSDLEQVLTQSFYQRFIFGDHCATDCESRLVLGLYAKYNIKLHYPFQNFIFRLYIVATIIYRNPYPRFQRINLCSLPEELIDDIACRVPRKTLLSLSCVSVHCRLALLRYLQRSIFFTVRYDHAVNHKQSWGARRFVNVLSDAITNACIDCSTSIFEMIRRKARAQIRYVSFANQWETMLPLQTFIYPPEPLDNPEFSGLFTSIAWVLHYMPITHLRLSGLGVTRRLAQRLAKQESLTRLTLETIIVDDCIINSLHPTLRMIHITFLTIGFGGSARSAGEESWAIVRFCVNVQHLFLYAVDENDFIYFPTEDTYRHIPHIHSVRKLHLQGTTRQLRQFAKWIRWAGDYHRRTGQITHFKIQAISGIFDSEIVPLLDALADFHSVRVLALEGLVDTTLAVRHIARRFYLLEGLSIVRLENDNQRTIRLCPWDSLPSEIAVILASMPRLQHFAANFAYVRHSFGPAAFHPSLFPILDDATSLQLCDSSVDEIILEHRRAQAAGTKHPAEHTRACTSMMNRRDSQDGLSDGLSIARVFAAYCRTLTSFAIKTDMTAFSCHMIRDSCGDASLYEIVDCDTLGGFEAWNPVHSQTWSEKD